MEHGIERRFLVKNIPDLSGNVPVVYEKYFVQVGDVIEEAVQKRGNILEYEKKICPSHYECHVERSPLREEEFESLKAQAMPPLIYRKYIYAFDPLVSINIFQGIHEGLLRADIKFNTIEEANEFEIPCWLGKDITQSPLGVDKNLAQLGADECKKLIHQEIASTLA